MFLTTGLLLVWSGLFLTFPLIASTITSTKTIVDKSGYLPELLRHDSSRHIHRISKKHKIDLSLHILDRLEGEADSFIRQHIPPRNNGVTILVALSPPINRVAAGHSLLESGRLKLRDLHRMETQLNLNLPLDRKREAIGQTLSALERSLEANQWDALHPPSPWWNASSWIFFFTTMVLFLRSILQHIHKEISHRRALFFLGLSYLAWSMIQYTLYWDPRIFLPREHFTINYLAFEYFALYMRFFEQLPSWVFARQGGIWIETLTNDYDLLLPNRILALVITTLTDLPLNTIWKFSYLFLGQGAFVLGVYLLAREIFGRTHVPLLLAGIFVYSGITLGALHQECFLGSYFYLPYLWWTAVRIPRHPLCLLIFASLLGLSFTITYPHHRIAYAYVVIISIFFAWKSAGTPIKWFSLQTWDSFKKYQFVKIAGLALGCFLLSASPSLFAAGNYLNEVGPTVRRQQAGMLKDFDTYLKLDAIEETSLWPVELTHFWQGNKLGTRHPRMLDNRVLFATCAVPLVLGLLFFVAFPGKRFLVGLILGVTLLAIGVHGPAPNILWYLLPGIRMFHAWHSFSSFITIHLTFLVAAVLGSFLRTPPSPRVLISLGGLLFIATLCGILPWLYGGLPGLGLFLLGLGWLGPRVFPPLCLTWLFVGSVLWALDTMQEYRYSKLAHSTFTDRFHNPDQFAGQLLIRGFPIVMPAEAKGMKSEAKRIAQTRGVLHWRKKNTYSPVSPKDLSFEPIENGFRVHFSQPKGSHLALLQYHDGVWESDAPLVRTPLNTIELRVHPQSRSVEIRRPPTIWQSLIFLCWLPLFGCILWWTLSRFLLPKWTLPSMYPKPLDNFR